MAYLEAIPKFAFGTAFDVIPEERPTRDHATRQWTPGGQASGSNSQRRNRRRQQRDEDPQRHLQAQIDKQQEAPGSLKDREASPVEEEVAGPSTLLKRQHFNQIAARLDVIELSDASSIQQHCDTTAAGASCSGLSDKLSSNSNNHEKKEQQANKNQTIESGPKVSAKHFKKLVKDAVRMGCRHFDCAPLYRTQPLVGQVLYETMQKSRVPRRELFITSKLPPNMTRVEHIERSCRQSMADLRVSYLDLFLIHAPFATKHNNNDLDHYPIDPDTGEIDLDNEENLLENAWLKVAELKRQGLVRFIGLSNVNLEQLNRLNRLHKVDVVQNEYHIYNQNRDLFDHCEEIDVHFEAYAAFGSPAIAHAQAKPCVVDDPLVLEVARRHRLTVGQVIIQWIHHQPLSYVLRSDSLEQLEENLKAARRIQISVNEMIDLDTLNKNVRVYMFDEHRGLHKHREYPFRDEIFEEQVKRSELEQGNSDSGAGVSSSNAAKIKLPNSLSEIQQPVVCPNHQQHLFNYNFYNNPRNPDSDSESESNCQKITYFDFNTTRYESFKIYRQSKPYGRQGHYTPEGEWRPPKPVYPLPPRLRADCSDSSTATLTDESWSSTESNSSQMLSEFEDSAGSDDDSRSSSSEETDAALE